MYPNPRYNQAQIVVNKPGITKAKCNKLLSKLSLSKVLSIISVYHSRTKEGTLDLKKSAFSHKSPTVSEKLSKSKATGLDNLKRLSLVLTPQREISLSFYQKYYLTSTVL